MRNVTFNCTFSLIPQLLWNRPNLQYVDLRNQKKIPDYFCLNSQNLRTVTSNGNIETIGKGAFKGCNQLKKLPEMPKLTKIDESAFFDCWLEGTIEFPSTLKSIGTSAFGFGDTNPYKAPEIDKIICNSLTPPEITGDGFAFSDVTHRTAVLYVPKESLDLYKNAYEWKEFYKIRAIGAVEASSVSLDKTSLNLQVGDEASISATVYPANTTDKTVTWTSSDTSVATVDNNGHVTALKIGTTTIRATCDDVSATCAVTVVATPAASVTLNKTEATLKATETVQLTATVAPETTTDKTVTWTSSDTSVATVDNNGLVTAVKVGTATITAICGTAKGTCAVTVVATPAASVTLNKTEATLKATETVQLTATVAPETTTDKTVTWTSSDEYIAKIDANGLVTAVAVGKATITATTANRLKAECAITVEKTDATGIIIDKEALGITGDNLEMRVGDVKTIFVKIEPETATDKSVTFESSNPGLPQSRSTRPKPH